MWTTTFFDIIRRSKNVELCRNCQIAWNNAAYCRILPNNVEYCRIMLNAVEKCRCPVWGGHMKHLSISKKSTQKEDTLYITIIFYYCLVSFKNSGKIDVNWSMKTGLGFKLKCEEKTEILISCKYEVFCSNVQKI